MKKLKESIAVQSMKENDSQPKIEPVKIT